MLSSRMGVMSECDPHRRCVEEIQRAGQHAVEGQPALQVVFSSGYAQDVALGRHPHRTNVGFLPKPYKAAALVHTIDAVPGENQRAACPTHLAV